MGHAVQWLADRSGECKGWWFPQEFCAVAVHQVIAMCVYRAELHFFGCTHGSLVTYPSPCAVVGAL
jgi:hypothetical protein